MRQIKQTKQTTSRTVFWPALALAISAFVLPAHAQSSGTSGSGTTSQEMQRGVPGVDVDTRTTGRPRANGVPGVDVDVGGTRRDTGVPGVDVDTRASGAAAGTGTTDRRAARADRN